ncbi:MAG TPA: alpha/beta hydrolase [Gemmatimonadaceae bacterium]|jgi:pimeloyl-ACP methyl ester carboxylesterase|nr:alpha/beta hydrolase [Gemmatimonadaceae bacterium]
MKSRIHLVFVHGFNSDKSTWNELWRQLSHGAFPRAELVPHWFEYNSKLVELNFSNAIPKLDEIRESFATYLSTELRAGDGEPIVLVGHSQGGLVILSTLAFHLDSRRAQDLRQIAHCVLISTPTNGSDFLGPARSIIRKLPWVNKEQEQQLRPLDEYIGRLQRRIAGDVLFAVAPTEHSCPIPITAIYGTEDPIVKSQSARWIFTHTEAVPGNHLSVHKPTDRDAAICRLIRRVAEDALFHVPADGTLVRTVPVLAGDADILRSALDLHNAHFTVAQGVRKDDVAYWLSHYRAEFGINLWTFAALINEDVRAFLMFHDDARKDIAIVDYLVSGGETELDTVAVRRLIERLQSVLWTSGTRTIAFEVSRPTPGSSDYSRDRARIRRFERFGARVVPHLPYVAPSMDGEFSADSEEPSLVMIASVGRPPAAIPWIKVREVVSYLYGTWYRNWFSRRYADRTATMDGYFNDLTARVLAAVPLHGTAALERFSDATDIGMIGGPSS